ncbi:HisA/HisF-related TIM barrel protein [Planctomycetes bacterium K23_9]|uniref:1-(5-phosphoribosyl)-5-[(5-phosphoribosylamino)methylideneamino] imidazole-4-carboxamide isomerase n=1 Tax=Stieleria marina TaxID=1930275 RepID=A0A517NWQ0_9BACT|nr:1-(5-phosphoribosyl)-5-[(5-phosphoribosylamino)methylideneamino] imidazole-4-carboxamide isomerase [Planctomycetes bacterium K23_9]
MTQATDHQLNRFAPVIDRLVGVIDFKGDRAVHAVAGQRDQYRGVVLGNQVPCDDPVDLANYYFGLGIRRLYIADLDGIVHGNVQAKTLHRLLSSGPDWDAVLLDFGFQADRHRSVAEHLQAGNPNLHCVVATEAAPDTSELNALTQIFGRKRTVLGMDYRGGEFVSRSRASSTQWISTAKQEGVGSVISLDVATVGTEDASRSLACCRQTNSALPDCTAYGGGGIASCNDVQAFLDAGCDYCLAATCLLSIEKQPEN